MLKLFTVLLGTGLCVGTSAVMAQNVDSAFQKEWGHFQTLLQRCQPMTGPEQVKCWADAKATFLASDFKCESFIGRDKEYCLALADLWRKQPPTAVKFRNGESAQDQDQGVAPTEDEDEDADSPADEPSQR